MSCWWGNENVLSRKIDLDDIQLIGSPWLTVGVPYQSSNDFKTKVYAGACASHLRLKSIDYTFKHYVEGQDVDKMIDPESDLIFKVTIDIKKTIISSLNYLMSIEKPDIPSLFAAGAALVRLQNTFKGAVLSLRTGLHFETLTMERMIIEQLAWIYRVHNYEGDFFNLEPSTCIKPFKKFIPYVGILYGQLSKKMHISPMATLDYIKAENDTLNITLSSMTQTKHDAFWLLKLLDIYCLVGEYIYADLLPELRFLKRDSNDNLTISESRPTIEIIDKYRMDLQGEGDGV